MRLKFLEIEGFRSFSGKVSIDCDADVILITGANGTGKTSLLDAILWGLCGVIPRFGNQQDKVMSLYAPYAFARVSLRLSVGSSDEIAITRRLEETGVTVSVEEGGKKLSTREAEGRLLQLLWPTALLAEKSFETLGAVLTQSVYLQQDLVRQFIEVKSDAERFEALSELVGTGRLTELQQQLDGSRRSWARLAKGREQEMQAAEMQVSRLRQEVTRRLGLKEVEPLSDLAVLWRQWWTKVRSYGVEFESIPSPELPTAAATLESSLRRLQSERSIINLRLSSLRNIQEQLRRFRGSVIPDNAAVESIETRVSATSVKLNELSERLSRAQQNAAEERRRLTGIQEAQASIQAFATLALRHLGEECPVCQQAYNKEQTKRRLERLASPQVSQLPGVTENQVGQLAAELAEVQVELAQAQETYRAHIQKRDEFNAILRAISEQLVLQQRTLPTGTLEPDRVATYVDEALDSLRGREQQAETLYAQGEQLAVGLARLSEQAQRGEFEKDLANKEKGFSERRLIYEAYQKTHQTATQIIEALREVGVDVVDLQLRNIEPLLRRIYSRIDPHPTFTQAILSTKSSYGKGRMDVFVRDPIRDIDYQDPSTTLSSSQLNALAVALFLSFNLATSSIPLEMAILDDPLQSLDDVNLLGLVDVLRRTRTKRQLVISTHDQRFSQLLRRKLRPVDRTQRTCVVTLQAWTPEGPSVTVSEVSRPDSRHSLLTA